MPGDSAEERRSGEILGYVNKLEHGGVVTQRRLCGQAELSAYPEANLPNICSHLLPVRDVVFVTS